MNGDLPVNSGEFTKLLQFMTDLLGNWCPSLSGRGVGAEADGGDGEDGEDRGAVGHCPHALFQHNLEQKEQGRDGRVDSLV